ncbi:alpha/beta hydrolase [Candidatus Gracilibacteria bacterium]|nr:alpha/beta hydrolase [Candidatus Gracilibacteria bacterium]
MKTALIIHGTGGIPEGNWFPWMKRELEELGYKVFIPKFPTPEGQSLESWTKAFEKYKKYIDEDTIFVAHSVGPAFVLSILENINTEIRACYFASGFLGLIDIQSFDELNKTITDRDFDWEKIKKNCQNFYMCHGSDDPYVTLKSAEEMSKKLGTEIDMIDGGGHLNTDSGFTEFPKLLEEVKKHS